MQNNSSLPRGRPKAASKPVKTREQAVAKTIKKLNRLEGRSSFKPEDNKYLMTLVDPENVVGVRYPDDLPKATAVFRGLINHNAYIFPTGNDCEPDGTYYNILSPTLINPLLEYRMSSFTALELGPTLGGDVFGGVITADDHSGLFPIVEDTAAIATSCDEMWIPPATTLNLKSQFSWRDQDFATPMIRGVRTDQTVFYGVPLFDFNASGSMDVIINIVQGNPAAVNPFTVTAVTLTGSAAFTLQGAPAAGQTRFSYTLGAATYQALFNAAGYIGLPGMGIRITNTTNRPFLLASYCWSASVGTLTTVDVPRFEGISLPDEETYAQTVDQYRVVSASNWLEYEGSDLMNGGQAASILYRAGQSAMENGLYAYGPVSEAPESYAGALKHGTYTFWTPNSDNDMLMRSLSPHNRWEYPFIVNAGIVSQPEQLNPVRLRIALNYEVVSTSQFYAFAKPLPCPEWIEEATMVLRRYPCTMANGKHWDWIKAVAKDALNFGKDAIKWGQENKNWLIPAATSLAALI
jgi:hypothetical protein